MSIIYEGYESNNKGRPINNKGRLIKTNSKKQIIFNSNSNPVLNNDNNSLPKRISQHSSENIKKHEKTMHSYRILKIENKNGSIIVYMLLIFQSLKSKENYHFVYFFVFSGRFLPH